MIPGLKNFKPHAHAVAIVALIAYPVCAVNYSRACLVLKSVHLHFLYWHWPNGKVSSSTNVQPGSRRGERDVEEDSFAEMQPQTL